MQPTERAGKNHYGKALGEDLKMTRILLRVTSDFFAGSRLMTGQAR